MESRSVSRKLPLASDCQFGQCRQLSVGVPCKGLYPPCNHPAINNGTHQRVSPSVVGADSNLYSQNMLDYPAWRPSCEHRNLNKLSRPCHQPGILLSFFLLLLLPFSLHHRYYESHIRQPLVRTFLLDPLPLQIPPPH